MKRSLVFISVIIIYIGMLPSAAAQVGDSTTFVVRLFNSSAPLPVSSGGVFDVPDDATEAGPAAPGQSYRIEVRAVDGDVLSFATMLVQSNNLFFAPDPAGIALFGADGTPTSGDVTDQVFLWDAGIKLNPEAVHGRPDQAPRQAASNIGPDEDGVIALIEDVDDGFDYPSVADLVRVSLEPIGVDSETGAVGFLLIIENVSGNSSLPSPISPGMAVVHQPTVALFEIGARAYPALEALAEDGDPTALGDFWLAPRFETEIGPAIWAVLPADTLFFDNGEVASLGVEALAEDGDHTFLVEELEGLNSGFVLDTINGRINGLTVAGDGYSFSFSANVGDTLMLVAMLAESNDWFYGVNGLALFDEDGTPIVGDRSEHLRLWDAGTEVDEPLGIGPNQGVRQPAANTGPDQNSVITRLLPATTPELIPDARYNMRLIIEVAE